jgi:hypothetical protein
MQRKKNRTEFFHRVFSEYLQFSAGRFLLGKAPLAGCRWLTIGFLMLGWHVSVYRQANGGRSPATAESEQGARLAVWQADVSGLGWLEKLAEEGKAVNLGGNGYPSFFTATAEVLLPIVVTEQMPANEDWLIPEGSYIPDPQAWAGKTRVEREAAEQCRPDEWLIVEIWDES